jgi:hypothetical protein
MQKKVCTWVSASESEIDSKYRPGGLGIHQIFISVPIEAGRTVKSHDASKSKVVRVLDSTNWGDVVAVIDVTIRQAKGMHGQAKITAYNPSLRS